jgi:branched-chain amino acid transport system permease protein
MFDPYFIIIIGFVIDGLVLGGIYLLISLGLSLIYGVAGVLNVSHGDMVMLAGLLTFFISNAIGLHLLGVIIATTVIIPLFLIIGILLYYCLIRPLTKRTKQELLIGSILITLGLSFLLQDLAATVFGTLPRSIYIGFEPIKLGELVVPFFRLVTFIIIVAIAFFIWIFLKYTFTGMAMRAVTNNREVALSLGIPIDITAAMTFGAGTVLAALGGILYLANGFPITPFVGLSLTVKALTVIVIGGTGKLTGTVIGAVILGVAETLTGAVISFYWAPAISILLLLIVLVIKPKGILGE